jgi:hypothetical protein
LLKIGKFRVRVGTLCIRQLVTVNLGIRRNIELQTLSYEGASVIVRFLYFYLERASVCPILGYASFEAIGGVIVGNLARGRADLIRCLSLLSLGCSGFARPLLLLSLAAPFVGRLVVS